MKYTTLAILAGFLLDQLFGDPYWLPHPIRAIGWLINKGETWIRGILPKTPMGEKTGGFFLVALVLGVTGILASGILYLAVHIHPLAGLIVESLMQGDRCCQHIGVIVLVDDIFIKGVFVNERGCYLIEAIPAAALPINGFCNAAIVSA